MGELERALGAMRAEQVVSENALINSSLIDFTSCIVKSVSSRGSFISSPPLTPQVDGPMT